MPDATSFTDWRGTSRSSSERASVSEAEGRMVYKKAECRRCGRPVDVFPLAGRTAYACAACQT